MRPLETRLIGLFYLVFSLLSLPFHIIVVLSILRSKLNRNRPPYVIIMTRSIFELCQLLIHALSGICAITGREFCEGVHTILSNALFFFWITTVFLHVLLCVNRFITFVTIRCATKNTVEMTYFLISVCILGGAFCMAGCSSDQMRFRLESMSWQVEKKSTFSIAIHYLQIALVILGIACCSFVILFLADQKRKLSETRVPIKQTEVRIFIHSTITFLLVATSLLMRHPLNLILNNDLQAAIILNICWILVSALPPFLLIWMNNEISKSIRELTIRDPATKVNTISVAT